MASGSADRFYNTKTWRVMRLFVLERDGHRCQIDDCGQQATEVDHIIPRSEAPHLALDPDNLRAACKFHNAQRSRSPHRVGSSKRRTSRDW